MDLSNPLFSLRRDERGKAIRDRAVVSGVAVGGLAYGLLNATRLIWTLPPHVSVVAVLIGMVTYFATSG